MDYLIFQEIFCRYDFHKDFEILSSNEFEVILPDKPLCVLSHPGLVRLSVTTWTMAHQAHLSVGFSRQEYWSGLSFPSPVRKYEVSEVKSLTHVRLFATSCTVGYQAPLSMGFSRQEYWSGLSFPSPDKPLVYVLCSVA